MESHREMLSVTMETKPLIESMPRSTTSNSTGVTIAVPVDVLNNETLSQWVFGETEDTVIIPVFVGLIVVWALAANLMFIYSVLSHQPTRSGFIIMLINISISDVIFSLIGGIVAIINHATYWSSGEVYDTLTCKLVHYTVFVSVYVVIYTLVIITVFRFFGEYMSNEREHVSYLSRCNAILACVVIWLAFLVSHLNFFIQKDIGMFQEPFACIQSDFVMNPEKERILWLTFLVCAFAVPLFLIAVASAYIIYKERRRRPALIRLEVVGDRSGHFVQSQAPSLEAEAKYRRQKTQLVITTALVRATCWVPTQVFVMADAFGLAKTEVLYRKAEMLSFCIALLACCITPLIYRCVYKEISGAFQEGLLRMGCTFCVTTAEEELSDMNETILSILSDSSNHINYVGTSSRVNYNMPSFSDNFPN